MIINVSNRYYYEYPGKIGDFLRNYLKSIKLVKDSNLYDEQKHCTPLIKLFNANKLKCAGELPFTTALPNAVAVTGNDYVNIYPKQGMLEYNSDTINIKIVIHDKLLIYTDILEDRRMVHRMMLANTDDVVSNVGQINPTLFTAKTVVQSAERTQTKPTIPIGNKPSMQIVRATDMPPVLTQLNDFASDIKNDDSFEHEGQLA